MRLSTAIQTVHAVTTLSELGNVLPDLGSTPVVDVEVPTRSLWSRRLASDTARRYLPPKLRISARVRDIIYILNDKSSFFLPDLTVYDPPNLRHPSRRKD